MMVGFPARGPGMEGNPLRVLIIEDNAVDAEICVHALRKAGFEVISDVVDTPEAFAQRLSSKTYDVILSDFRLPRWTGLEALKTLREEGKDTPFILVTGSLGDEVVVECLKQGATDYVLKDRPARLSAAVRRALEEKSLREERKQLEMQLLQSQKMEAIGRLAGGIAHDFNNLLTIINGYSQLALDQMDPQNPLRKKVEEIQKAGERAASLTSQLLVFSRKQVLEPQVLQLNSVVANMDKMLRRLIGEDIDLRTGAPPDLGWVKADQGQIEQIIMNLAINSRDAMPKGGQLTIETRDILLDETYAVSHLDVVPGPYVMLAVSDTGVGMDEKTQSHIFEPFFTTKEQGKGTGLGLATVYGIVKQSGGYVWVYSEPGKGTTFKIYLPQVTEAVTSGAVTSDPKASAQGTETILLVEDEPALRTMVREILTSNGYRILEAKNGQTALEVSEKHTGPIHLLLTDVVMPGISGRELAERMSAIFPQMKVLFMSGYTDDAVVRHGVLGTGTVFLQKPFSPDAVARKVRAVLDSR